MHLLYLDASGDSVWPPPYGPSPNRWYVLLGLSLEENAWIQAHEKTTSLLRKFLPSVTPRELKYSALIAGAPPYEKLSRLQRKELADAVFGLILELKPVLFAAAIDKLSHKRQYGGNAYSPHVWALQLIAPRFHKYLDRIKALGIFVMDAEERKRDTMLKELIQDAREQGIVLKTPYRPLLTNTNLPRIIESVLFAKSDDSPGLQLADFAGHAVWRHFERKQSDRYNQIYRLFDENMGEVYGLRVWP